MNTPEGRASFVYIFTPAKRYNPTNDPAKDRDSYELELMIPKTTDLTTLTGVINQAIADQWPQGMPQGVAFPIHDGDLATCSLSDPTLRRDKYPAYAGHWFIKISSLKPVKVYRQTILGQDGSPLPAVEITSDNEFFAGCNCIVNVNVSAYHVGNSVGVNFYINAIMMTTPGERLGGGGCDPAVFGCYAKPAGTVPSQDPSTQQQAPVPGGFQQPGAPVPPSTNVGPAQTAPQQAVPQQGYQQPPPAPQPQNQGASVQQVGQGGGFPPPALGGQVPGQ